jgi:hypothetical protein
LFAQDSQEDRLYGGVNLGHALAVDLISKTMSNSVEYLPIHVDFHFDYSRNFGLAGSLIYRKEVDGNSFATQEFGIAAGPAFYLDRLKSLFASMKLGVGCASGTDYLDRGYTRFDFIIQPEVGTFVPIVDHFRMTLGIGLQTLLLISESPSRYSGNYGWDWKNIGMMSHYYLPVLNVGFGVTL